MRAYAIANIALGLIMLVLYRIGVLGVVMKNDTGNWTRAFGLAHSVAIDMVCWLLISLGLFLQGVSCVQYMRSSQNSHNAG